MSRRARRADAAAAPPARDDPSDGEGAEVDGLDVEARLVDLEGRLMARLQEHLAQQEQRRALLQEERDRQQEADFQRIVHMLEGLRPHVGGLAAGAPPLPPARGGAGGPVMDYERPQVAPIPAAVAVPQPLLEPFLPRDPAGPRALGEVAPVVVTTADVAMTVPRLTSFDLSAVTSFLLAEAAYQDHRADRRLQRLPLRDMIDLDLRQAIPYLFTPLCPVKLYNSAEEVPLDDEGVPVFDKGADVTFWDASVRSVLTWTIMSQVTGPTSSVDAVLDLLRASVSWESRGRPYSLAYAQFWGSWTKFAIRTGINALLSRAYDPAGKVMLRVTEALVGRLFPVAFRQHVQKALDRRVFKCVRTLQEFLTTTGIDTLYAGMVQGATDFRSGSSQQRSTSNVPAHGSAQPVVVDLTRSAKGDNPKPKASYVTPSPAPAAGSGKASVPGPKSAPSQQTRPRQEGVAGGAFKPECWGCKGPHRIDDCPHKSAEEKARIKQEKTVELAARKRPMTAKRLNAASDGRLTIPSTTLEPLCFTLDTAATHTFCSVTQLEAIASALGTAVTHFREPIPVQGAFANAPATCELVIPQVALEFGTGGVGYLDSVTVVGCGGELDGILIGDDLLRARLGVDIHTVVKRRLGLAPTDAETEEPAGTGLSDSTFRTAARAASMSVFRLRMSTPAPVQPGADDTQQLDSVQPVMDRHDPAGTREMLKAALDRASEHGLPEAERERLEEVVLEECFDAFRIHIDPTDPPAAVDPADEEVDPALFNERSYQPRFGKLQSDTVHSMVSLLEEAGCLERVDQARYASAVHPVLKADRDPTKSPTTWYRLTWDLVKPNKYSKPIVANMPDPRVFGQYIAGHGFFAKLDLYSGFWQIPLSKRCRKNFAVRTDRGIWLPTRVLQGMRNGPAWFQSSMTKLLRELVMAICLVFIDDLLIYGKTAADMVSNLIVVIKRLHSVGFKISAKKLEFYATEIEYCGRVYSADGVRFDPEYIAALTEMLPPVVVHDLRSYIGMVIWVGEMVENLAELLAPMHAVLTRAQQAGKAAKLSHKAAENLRLADHGWTPEVDDAFKVLNERIGHNTFLTHPTDDPEWTICVTTDASDTGWSGVITICPTDQLHLPLMEQKGHRPVVFSSGRFTGASRNWSTLEKEAFAIKEMVVRHRLILMRVRPFVIFTDHRNLKYLFDPEVQRAEGRRQAADRVERWCIIMAAYWYTITAIPGEHNVAADLLTRWGARRDLVALEQAEPAPAAGRTELVPSGEPMSAMVLTRSQSRATQAVQAVTHPGQEPAVAATALAPLSPVADAPAAGEQHPVPVDDDLDEAGPDVAEIAALSLQDAPTEEELVTAQASLTEEEIAQHKLVFNDKDLACTAKGQVFVPDERLLRLRLCICGHQQFHAHRGTDATYAAIRQAFWWPGMRMFVRRFCHRCLVCQKVSGGKVVPRPLLHIPRPTEPNMLVAFDYMSVRGLTATSAGEFTSLFVMIDCFSSFIELTPTRDLTSESAARAIAGWCARYGTPPHWMSDQGPHFTSTVMEELASLLGVEHRFTTVYAPWANGIVERANRDVLQLLRSILMTRDLPLDRWATVVEAAQAVHNNSPSAVVAGYSPRTAFMGRPSTSPFNVVFNADPFVPMTVGTQDETVKAAVRQLQSTLSEVMQATRARGPAATPARSGGKDIDFDVGDYVLTSSLTDPGEQDKLNPVWFGPALVVDRKGPRTFEVEDIATRTRRALHARFLKRFSNRDLTLSVEVRRLAAFGSRGAAVDHVAAHRRTVAGNFECLVDFEDTDRQWLPFDQLAVDHASGKLRTYLRTISDAKEREHLLARLTTLRAQE